MTIADPQRVFEFLKENVVGRAVVAPPIITNTDRGRLESAFEEDVIYSNLCRTATGFSFDLTNLSRGTRYLPRSDGKEYVAEGTYNTVRVLRYEMALRRAADFLIGHARFLSSTNSHPDPMAGTAFLVRMWMEDDVLLVDERMSGFAEMVSADGGPRPVAIDGVYRYAVKDGILVVCYQQTTYEVDPHSLERKPTGERFPEQVSKEASVPSPLLPA
ncbi:hypothetical protein [Amaricoccus sp.]|uniref:hypothetical protein n=1 Tax=Amaricoccus sp. TaxID=1872485 RepID=UPI001E07ECA1|nr:hypothetical protein [Amaricoccus sp.]MCC0068004.1 hypothetical protein [Rhodovulum sp.]HRW16484.1 hypothetical protein [Amaricoccus sp.]